MMMDTAFYSETVVSSYQTTRRHNPETPIKNLCLYVKYITQSDCYLYQLIGRKELLLAGGHKDTA
jgi:hypothetical protein